jgi:phosphoribosyl 1,2-cyclic phosphodiesterase
LEFSSLGSGSKGNGTLVRHDDCLLLIDCGFSVKQTEKRLARLGVSAEQLDALLITHEHGDHIGGVGPLSRKYQLPVYMTAGTKRSKDIGVISKLCIIKNYRAFTVKSIEVTPVAVPHDAAEPAQYVFEAGRKRLGLLTDLGGITPHVESHYRTCDGLLLEANHDLQMLASSQYPPTIKQRVSSSWGHLSNEQAASFLSNLNCNRLQQLVIGHISQQNNCLELVRKIIDPVVSSVGHVQYACQQQGFDWIAIK